MNNSEKFFDISDESLKLYDNIWFSSDAHFMHANIIKYCRRPFELASQMDEALIAKWNELVSSNDLVFYLGDFSMSKEAYTQILPRLHFKKMFFILGNHDRKSTLNDVSSRGLCGEIEVCKQLLIKYQFENYYLTHRPIDAHDKYPTVCGHVHEKWKALKKGDSIKEFSRTTNSTREIALKNNIINVGVDLFNFYPVKLDEVISELKRA